MPKFKLIVSDPKTGKASTTELDEQKSQSLISREIGEARITINDDLRTLVSILMYMGVNLSIN